MIILKYIFFFTKNACEVVRNKLLDEKKLLSSSDNYVRSFEGDESDLDTIILAHALGRLGEKLLQTPNGDIAKAWLCLGEITARSQTKPQTVISPSRGCALVKSLLGVWLGVKLRAVISPRHSHG